MAKNKQPEESNRGLTIALVICILLMLLLGTLTYFGYSGQEEYAKKAKEAQNAKNNAETLLGEAQARLIVTRMALGTASDEDQQKIVGLRDVQKDSVNEEYTAIIKKLLDEQGVPPEDFRWELLSPGEPGVRPSATLPELVVIKEDQKNKALQAASEQKKSRADAEKSLAQARATNKQQKAEFDAQLNQLQTELNRLRQQKSQELTSTQDELKNMGRDIQQVNRNKFDEIEQRDQEIRKLTTANKDLQERVDAYESQEKAPEVKLNVPRGTILRRNNNIVTIDLGSRVNLRPGITFSVFPVERDSLSTAELRNNIRIDLSGRVYDDNDNPTDIPTDIKGAIEVVEILGPGQARAKITFELSQVRNSIRPGDVLFNPAWSPNLREHVVIAGIFDLNGDGDDDTEQVIRLLEEQGVIVDGYLDLKERKVKGPGMTLNTGYYIEGPKPTDLGSFPLSTRQQIDPRIEFKQDILKLMSQLDRQAGDLGVQKMSARKFAAMMGFKVPVEAREADYNDARFQRPLSERRGERPAARQGLPNGQ